MNPFRKQESEWVEVTNSELTCKYCFEITSHGNYCKEKQLLEWTCPNGHVNQEEIEL